MIGGPSTSTLEPGLTKELPLPLIQPQFPHIQTELATINSKIMSMSPQSQRRIIDSIKPLLQPVCATVNTKTKKTSKIKKTVKSKKQGEGNGLLVSYIFIRNLELPFTLHFYRHRKRLSQKTSMTRNPSDHLTLDLSIALEIKQSTGFIQITTTLLICLLLLVPTPSASRIHSESIVTTLVTLCSHCRKFPLIQPTLSLLTTSSSVSRLGQQVNRVYPQSRHLRLDPS